jgi:hypothetical protein
LWCKSGITHGFFLKIIVHKDRQIVKGLVVEGRRPSATEVVASVRVVSGEVFPLYRRLV